MAETVKFTEEELNEIKELQNLFNTVIYQAGQTHLEKIALSKKSEQVEENFGEIKKREQELVSKLTTTYGQGKINLESGEFTPVDTEGDKDTE
ncbi:hypothetical protein OAA40_00330 [bacterium]|nr:hypothetical protein [bacterium]